MWSKKYKKCIVCGTTERKHKGNGRCTKCHQKYHRELNPKRYKEYGRKYYKEYPEKCKEYNKKSYKKYSEKNRKKATKYRKENSEKIKEKSKEYREKNREILKEKTMIFRKLNPEKIKEQNKKWREANPEKAKELNRKWSRKNIKRKRELLRKWEKANPEKVKAISRRKYEKHRNDIHYKLKNSISGSIYRRLKSRLSSKNNKSTFSFLPYTIEELKHHLEKLFQSGMTWENYGQFGWHIDHRKPDISFNYTSVNDKEFQECWALKNLQPLWWQDNLRKGSKLNY